MARHLEKPVVLGQILDDEERDATRLLFMTKSLLDRALVALADRSQALATLDLQLSIKGADPRTESLTPAEPTLDAGSLLALIRLRLDTLRLGEGGGVDEIQLVATGVGASAEQLHLFTMGGPGRDPRKASEAFARLRARLGNDAIVVAELTEGHLPEARFSWKRLESPPPAEAVGASSAEPLVLVRRFVHEPTPLPPDMSRRGGFALRDTDGFLLEVDAGGVMRSHGPAYRVGGLVGQAPCTASTTWSTPARAPFYGSTSIATAGAGTCTEPSHELRAALVQE